MNATQQQNHDNSKRFAIDLLKLLKVSPGKNNYNFLLAWQAAENSEYRYNPLGDTLPFNGSSGSFVQDYKSYQDGLAATYTTLTSGIYTYLVYCIKNDVSPDDPAIYNSVLANLQRWGTGSLALTVYKDQYKNVALQAGFGAGYLIPLSLALIVTVLFKK